jgi:hypothetical protein
VEFNVHYDLMVLGDSGIQLTGRGSRKVPGWNSPSTCPKAVRIQCGSPHWKHSELFFEKKQPIPALQQVLIAIRCFGT